ncbi:Mitochondrial-processing peptidase subunit beta, partial [Phytophthora palmivora]
MVSMRSLQTLRRAAQVAVKSSSSRFEALQSLVPQARAFSQAHTPTQDVDPKDILRPEITKDAKPQLSLEQELPGLPQLKPASQLKPPQTEISVLPSGLRVISQETYGQAATLGIFIDAGSRFEDDDSVGVSHLLEHLGFKSTTSRSHAQLVHEIEDIGALTTSSCGREQIIYTI